MHINSAGITQALKKRRQDEDVAYSSDARGELNAPARELIIHPHKKPPKAISHPQETAEDFPKNSESRINSGFQEQVDTRTQNGHKKFLFF